MASHLPAFGVILLLPSFLPAVQGLPLTSTPPSQLAVASRLPLLATPPQALRDHFGWPKLEHAASDKGEGVWALLRKGVDPRAHEDLHLWSANLRSPRLQRLLHEECAPVSCATMSEHSISSDGTQKLLLQLEDGLAVECVVIPMPGGTTSSLCISSQVGCSHACAFCSTGTMGLLRNLRAEEILAQVWMAQRVVREQRLPALVNIVFMGMGEPLNNFEQVATLDVSRILLQWIQVFSYWWIHFPQVRIAVDMLVHPKAFGFSRRCVCVSTVGPSPSLISRAVTSLPCRLAWSVHAADDKLRRLLVPTTCYPMSELRDAFADALATKPSRVQGLVVEVALIAGINDQLEHAEQVRSLTLLPFLLLELPTREQD